MTTPSPPTISRVSYHRIYTDAHGESRFDTVTVEQRRAQAAPPAAPFYVSNDGPASSSGSIRLSPAGSANCIRPRPASSSLSWQAGWRWRRPMERCERSDPETSSCWKIPRGKAM